MKKGNELGLLLSGLLSIGLFTTCGPERPSFHPAGEGVAFRRVTLGGSGPRVGAGDGVKLSFRASPWEDPDSTFCRDTSYLLIDDPEGGLTQALRTMKEGDSSIFRFDSLAVLSGQLPSLEQDAARYRKPLRLEVRLLERMRPFALMEWVREHRPKDLKKGSWKEWKRIREFVRTLDSVPAEHFVDGIYLFQEKKGSGPRVKVGRRIALHYKGYLPDRTVFDDSYKREEPLRFRFGAPEQVIRGLGIGLRYMREGGKAKLVIPSYLAFGKKGGRTGILPPHTFVYYKIEVVNVERS